MRIYNLFPLLCGTFPEWKSHIKRAAEMEFDWVFMNPVQQPGQSGSLYSIADYFALNPQLIDSAESITGESQLRQVAHYARELKMRLMVDLVINHCAVDAAIVQEHPNWFIFEENGRVSNPHCMEDGKKVVWRDLARFNHRTREQDELIAFYLKIIEYLIGLGFEGFRCDAAYQIPAKIWERIIMTVREKHPQVVFTAETLGCPPKQTRDTATAGFDYVFNSVKWWDYSSSWLLEQYHLVRECAPSIGFAESHDTPRLYAECHQNIAEMKQRYLFSAFFSAGVLMPVGFEFGFQKQLHVVKTTPKDWEETNFDLRAFITSVNQLKSAHTVFQEDGPTTVLNYDNPSILLLWKATKDGEQEALIILNKDNWHHQYFYAKNVCDYVQQKTGLIDISPEYKLEFLPAPFEYDLRPGQVITLLSKS